MQQRRAGGRADACGQTVGALGVALPDTGFNIGEKLRGHVARLRQQVAGALAAQLEIAHQRAIEEHHRLGRERPVLGGAEGKHIDAGAPGHIRRVTAEKGEGIGKARAVHVDFHAPGMGQLGELRDLLGTVAGAELGRLCEGERRGLHAVHVPGVRLERRSDGGRVELAVRAGQQLQLPTSGEKAGRAALIHRDVGLMVREDRPVGGTQGRERERVGGGAGGHREGLYLRAEMLTERRVEAQRPIILAVGACQPMVGLLDRRENLRAGGGGVIAEESQVAQLLVRRSQSMRQRKDQAPKARNTSVVAARYNRLGAICASPAPSSITARAASSSWVRGKTCATHCTQRGEPSSENQMPDSSIMGQVRTLRSPPTSSSLEKRAAMVSPRAIIDSAPSTASSARSSGLPAEWKPMMVPIPRYSTSVTKTIRLSRESTCALRNSNAVSGVACSRLRKPLLR